MPSHSFGTLPDGRAVECFVLESPVVELRVIPFGAIITSLRTASRDGRRGDVVLGHGDVASYSPNPHYLGAVVGRYGNRIAHGRFSLAGKAIQLTINHGGHHLHGGVRGFDQQLWTVADGPTAESVSFSLVSPAGEEQYPGTMEASVTYRLSADNVVEVRYAASTDADTPINLTQHSYFNLSADPTAPILDHELEIHADAYTPVDSELIPEGGHATVEGTPFDFRAPRIIGDQLTRTHEQLCRGNGFDHNWVLRNDNVWPKPAARLRHRPSGRVLDVATTEPGLQFYSGQLLRSSNAEGFDRYAGLCLETQHFPDSPNRPDFPSTILRAGQRYESLTTWTFSVD